MDKKQIPVLLAVLGVAAVALVYFLYFQPTMEEVNRLKSEDQQLQARIAELEALRDQRDFFIEETEKMSAKVDEIYDQFPANVIAEDAIREGIDIEDGSDVINTSITYEAPTVAYTPIGVSVQGMSAIQAGGDAAAGGEETAEEQQPAAEDEEESTGFELVQQPVMWTFEGDLNQFMRAAMTVNKTGERDVIDMVTLVYDSSTGLLSGEMDVSKYYVTGRADKDEEYEPAAFNVPTGSQNLFSTYSQSAAVSTDEGEGEEGNVGGNNNAGGGADNVAAPE